MKLYWAPQTRSSRAIWMLEEAGVDYELELVDIRAADRRDSAAFRAASPMGKVPALADGKALMAESAAICLYLADRYSDGRLAPAIDHPDRGRFLYWLMYTPTVVEPAMGEKFSGAESNHIRNGWGDFDSMILTWEQGLGDREWIIGDSFSAADVMLGSSAIFLQMFGMLPESRVLADYAERCQSRQAQRRAMEISS